MLWDWFCSFGVVLRIMQFVTLGVIFVTIIFDLGIIMSTILVDKLLETVFTRGASDLHIAVGQPPVLRLHGRLVKLETKILEPEDTVSLMKSITPERCQQELQQSGSTDFGFAFGDKARFRVSVFKQRGNTGLVLRQIPNKLLSMEQLQTPPVMTDLILRPRGLVLVTGPTGSGKSTTLAACIDYLNNNVDHHIITIEDPIEFYHYHRKSTVNQREVGVDVPTFAEAIRRALRQDPDVILVGELRDLETIEAAITAAETGHIVFGTLHTSSAAGTINRIIDVFPTNQQDQIRTQLSTSIIGILAQQLLPRIQGGRVAAYEMLVVTSAIANLIRENKTFRITSSIQTGHKLGMQLLDDHLFRLWRDKVVNKEDALTKSNLPDALAAKMLRYEAGELSEDDATVEVEEETNTPKRNSKIKYV
ncbi:MAG: type IV pilus twitching motility protein PilT [Planctomycetaceae bacterium]|jgi:twitching motility protein PilT|nr:type IV pilus twitching motility protein PilT [Planctomycetaceae bacterium]